MAQVELVDYGGGNVGSLRNCLARIPLGFTTVARPSGERPLILPGVGAFGAVMDALRQDGLDRRVADVIRAGTPFLGICVGLQVLLDGSEESPGVPGLGILPGQVVRFQAPKVPQVGWNEVVSSDQRGFVYFVNSYHACPAKASDVWFQADYHGPFCAAVRRDNVSAFQFHPEKSGAFGHQLIREWFERVQR